jgi:hypothetical protein
MSSSAPRLSRTRNFLFRAFVVVWFGEMALWGVRPLSELWTRVWQIAPPADPRLATAFYLTHAFEAAAKGALGVLAVHGVRSRHSTVRNALFVSMALVPPLNLAFPFRAEGFPRRATMIGTIFSLVLWGAFFLFRDRAAGSERTTDAPGDVVTGGSPSIRQAWFALNAAVLTLAAALFLFAPGRGLALAYPCLLGLPDSAAGAPSGVTLTGMNVGTHLLAVATATWIATVYARRYRTLGRAVAAASTVHAGLLCAVPFAQLALNAGRECATSSLLVYSVPLFAGWLLYDGLWYLAQRAGARTALDLPATN